MPDRDIVPDYLPGTGIPEALSFQAAHSVIPSRARNLVQKAGAINWYDASDPSLRLRLRSG